ncbi:replication initiator [Actinoplanes sp. GCM10030250]|uniref:replication initiator n=1 Tax=Actinoplanes sp. GCM10030250 TaxID=3273376 RepID=UPI0036230268
MSTSTLDLVPREQTARGTGSNAEASHWAPHAPAYSATGQALARAAQPGYFQWLEHVRAAGECTRPIRLTGTLDTIEATTGRLLDSRHTDQLPDTAIYKACGNRRASVCPSCARTYQRDAFQILRSFLIGGKGIPTTVAQHGAAFATFTAPGFGTVHTRNVRKHTCRNRKRCDCRPDPCHARRDTGLCEHGNPAVCWMRHDTTDPALGQPLCLDCYDHHHQVVWNLFSTELWHRTKQATERHLARTCRARRIPSVAKASPSGKTRNVPPVQVTHGKVAEMQRRGVVHFHALLRLDGVHPTDPDAVIPPPPGIGIDDLVDALHAAVASITFTTPAHPDQPTGWHIAWGDVNKGFDVKTLMLAGDGAITDDMVLNQLAGAGYMAKYATKSTEATGYSSTRISATTDDFHADPHGDHIARSLAACWNLGRPLHRSTAHSDTGSPDSDTPAQDTNSTGTADQRQPRLDTEPANTEQANPFTRLRRWTHMLGFGGHFLTKTRRRVVAFKTLRDIRVRFRRADDQTETATVRAADHPDETTLIVGSLTFAGVGWHTSGDALLANSAAAQARERHEAGREELAHALDRSPMTVVTAA